MSLVDKLPTLADDGLSNLFANAERLEKAGSQAQRAQAASLIPAIKAEMAARQAAKQERAQQAREAAAKARSGQRKPRGKQASA